MTINTVPYPGLRPFTREEAHIFFGRDNHTNQLMDQLAETRFIAVTGLSGCGKSSLVRAGLLANLECGYIAEAGSDWCILTMHPGLTPLDNLERAVSAAAPPYSPPGRGKGWVDLSGVRPKSETHPYPSQEGNSGSRSGSIRGVPLPQRPTPESRFPPLLGGGLRGLSASCII